MNIQGWVCSDYRPGRCSAGASNHSQYVELDAFIQGESFQICGVLGKEGRRQRTVDISIPLAVIRDMLRQVGHTVDAPKPKP